MHRGPIVRSQSEHEQHGLISHLAQPSKPRKELCCMVGVLYLVRRFLRHGD
jgi:hypothetical protein